MSMLHALTVGWNPAPADYPYYPILYSEFCTSQGISFFQQQIMQTFSFKYEDRGLFNEKDLASGVTKKCRLTLRSSATSAGKLSPSLHRNDFQLSASFSCFILENYHHVTFLLILLTHPFVFWVTPSLVN